MTGESRKPDQPFAKCSAAASKFSCDCRDGKRIDWALPTDTDAGGGWVIPELFMTLITELSSDRGNLLASPLC